MDDIKNFKIVIHYVSGEIVTKSIRCSMKDINVVLDHFNSDDLVENVALTFK